MAEPKMAKKTSKKVAKALSLKLELK